MLKILKYSLAPGDMLSIEASRVGKILRFDNQKGVCTVWVEIETPKEGVKPRYNLSFLVIGTGWDVPEEFQHVGTIDMGPFVWHCYCQNRVLI